MIVWNSMLLKIIIISLGVVKQHVRFIRVCFENRAKKKSGKTKLFLMFESTKIILMPCSDYCTHDEIRNNVISGVNQE